MIFSISTQQTYGDTGDFKEHWAQGTIQSWISKDLLRGYNDGSVRPNANITRAEFFTLINRIFGFEDAKDIVLADVHPSDWFATEVQKAVAANYVAGYPDGTIRPNQLINRQEAALILYRVFQFASLSERAEIIFSDKNKISSWGNEAVSFLSQSSYIKGYPDGTFRPDTNINRAEAFTMIQNIMGELYNVPGIYTKSTKGNMIINQSNVILKDCVIEGNLYITEGLGKGKVILDGVTVLGEILIQGGEEGVFLENSDLNVVKVNKKTGAIKIIMSGNTKINQIELQSETVLEVEEKVSIEKIIVRTTKPIKINRVGTIKAIQLGVKDTQVEIKEKVIPKPSDSKEQNQSSSEQDKDNDEDKEEPDKPVEPEIPQEAEEPTITVTKAVYDDLNGVVTISGYIDTGVGQQITLKVMDTEGRINQLDQTTSITDGYYEFSYKLKEGDPGGIYRVFVGGEGIKIGYQGRATFEVTESKMMSKKIYEEEKEKLKEEKEDIEKRKDQEPTVIGFVYEVKDSNGNRSGDQRIDFTVGQNEYYIIVDERIEEIFINPIFSDLDETYVISIGEYIINNGSIPLLEESIEIIIKVSTEDMIDKEIYRIWVHKK